MNARVSNRAARTTFDAAVTGLLVGFAQEGREASKTPLVTFQGQPGTAALVARTTMDLHAAHIGQEVVLMFEGGDLHRPIVLGVLRAVDANALDPGAVNSGQAANQPGSVEVDVDGKRMVVSAKEQLVLRCGKATITLTKAGKVLIEGTYVSSRSSGVQRIKGGSIQLN